jgi:hypothetical protein
MSHTSARPSHVRRHPPLSRGLAALSGVLAAAAGLGVGELIAALSPEVALPGRRGRGRGHRQHPPPVARWAIDTFGTADKAVLIAGTLVLLALAAAGLGVLATAGSAWRWSGSARSARLGAPRRSRPRHRPGRAARPGRDRAHRRGDLLVLLSGLARRPVVTSPPWRSAPSRRSAAVASSRSRASWSPGRQRPPRPAAC